MKNQTTKSSTKNPKTKIKSKSSPKIHTSTSQNIPIQRQSSSPQFGGSFSTFKYKNIHEWKLTTDKKGKVIDVIIYFDDIPDESCLLTIFPKSTMDSENEFIDFPICMPISQFPDSGVKAPYKLSSFDKKLPDYEITPKKTTQK